MSGVSFAPLRPHAHREVIRPCLHENLFDSYPRTLRAHNPYFDAFSEIVAH